MCEGAVGHVTIQAIRALLAALQLDATEPDSFSEAVETGDKQEGEKPSSVTDGFKKCITSLLSGIE